MGEVNTECKATMMMNTSGVKCIVDEVLHAETELEQFSPMGDEKARATWRRRLGEISDDYQRQLAGGMALGTVKSVAPYIRRLKEPVLDLEQRMFDVLGMAFFRYELASEARLGRRRRGSMMTYKTARSVTIMRVAGSATSAMRKPQKRKRVRNDEA